MEKPSVIQLELFENQRGPITQNNDEKGDSQKDKDPVEAIIEKKEEKNKPFMTVEEYQNHQKDNEGLQWWQK
jgi:hypothetical protein